MSVWWSSINYCKKTIVCIEFLADLCDDLEFLYFLSHFPSFETNCHLLMSILQ